MIDIHCHVLPGLDDGPQALEVSLQMTEMAVKEGITEIVATPHCIPEVFFNEGKAVLSKTREFQEILDAKGIPLRILPGMEVHLTLDVPARLSSGSALTVCDFKKHMLLELPLNSVPAYAGQVIFEIMLKGIKPIIAHPERNKEIAENPRVLHELIEKGCLVQITAGSLTGRFGSTIQELTQEFLSLGWVDFIASDAHDTIRRPFQMKEAWARAKELVGEERANQLVIGNPTKLINGEAINKADIEPYPEQRKRVRHRKDKGLLGRLSRLFR
ncbi:exopolysaccharide biosynthesis protein [Desulfotomaculum defluvii]